MFTSHNKTFSEITSQRNAQYSLIYTGHIISHSHWTRVFPCWPFQLSWVFFFLVHAPPLKLDQPDLLALDCFLMSVLTHGMGSWRSVTRLFLLSKLYALRPPLCHTRSSILYSAPERLWNVIHKFTYNKKKKVKCTVSIPVPSVISGVSGHSKCLNLDGEDGSGWAELTGQQGRPRFICVLVLHRQPIAAPSSAYACALSVFPLHAPECTASR